MISLVTTANEHFQKTSQVLGAHLIKSKIVMPNRVSNTFFTSLPSPANPRKREIHELSLKMINKQPAQMPHQISKFRFIFQSRDVIRFLKC